MSEEKKNHTFLPADFDEEVATLKNGLDRVVGKFKKADPADGPVPVDQVVGKMSFGKELKTIGKMLAAAAPSADKPAQQKEQRAAVQFQEDDDEPTTHFVTESDDSKLGKKAKEKLISGVDKITSEKNREIAGAAAYLSFRSFSTAFHGVAAGLSDLKHGIGKKSPRTAQVLDKVGGVISGASSLVGGAARIVSRGVKNVGANAGARLKDLKDSGTVEKAGRKLGEKTDSALHNLADRLNTAARSTATKFGELKDKSRQKMEERREHLANGETKTAPADEKLKTVTEKARANFRHLRERAAALKQQRAEAKAEKAAERAAEKAAAQDQAQEQGNSKLKQFADSFSEKARELADKARAKAERFYDPKADEPAPAGSAENPTPFEAVRAEPAQALVQAQPEEPRNDEAAALFSFDGDVEAFKEAIKYKQDHSQKQ